MITDIRKFIQSGNFGVVGITGGAGSGKTTLTKFLDLPTYHVDDAFFGDSEYRTKLLKEKNSNLDTFLDSCNMYNWWDWELVEATILERRKTEKPLLVEGALLGGDSILRLFDIIIFLYESQESRFNRLLERDWHKRPFYQAVRRFLITEYSEGIYYRSLFSRWGNKIVYIDSNYNFMYQPPKFQNEYVLPYEVRVT
jgi:uridine kinase